MSGESRGFGGCTCVDQHGGGLDAVGFHTDPVDPVSEAGEHFAAHFPAVQLCCWIGGCGPAQGATYCVDVISGHVAMVVVIY